MMQRSRHQRVPSQAHRLAHDSFQPPFPLAYQRQEERSSTLFEMLKSRTRSRMFKWVIVIGALTLLIFGLPSNVFSRRHKPAMFTSPSSSCIPAQSVPAPASGPQAPQRLGAHIYRPDGLIEVNEDGPHPIFELIEQAERAWNEKLRRASNTLEEAVQEYRQRYNRHPPRGFDLWWKYVKKHAVQLPDEYDQIFHDLEPFWGIDPSDLKEIQSELEKKKDSYTLGKTSTSKVSVVTYAFQEGKYNQLIVGSTRVIDMLNEIHEYLPPFRATFSPHDGPNRLSDYGVKDATLRAASTGSHLTRATLPQIYPVGWASACSPTSRAREKPLNLNNPPPPPSKKTFIHNHVATMDPCNHPELFHHHSQFLSHGVGPTPQHAMVPEFSQCTTMLHHNIRIPTPYGWLEDILPRSNDPEWDEKVDERLLWRGSHTGMFRTEETHWHHAQRDFMVGFVNDLNGTIKVLPPVKDKKQKLGPPKTVRKARVNPALMDIAFVGEPMMCSPDICRLMEKIYPWRGYQSVQEAGNYKYIIDVDGNGWSGRFKKLITSNSLIFKSTIYPEWYSDRIAPWVHYVPVQLDLSDLHDALIFFGGDGNGEGAHEDLARKIAVAGRKWSKTFWRREDLIAYFFRLILEYARVMSVDREAMSYTGAQGEKMALLH